MKTMSNRSPYWMKEIKEIVFNDQVGSWCRLPYPGHKGGCPNYADPKHPYCPPHSPHLTDILDLDKPVYLTFSEFNLRNFEIRMKKKHVDWSKRRCRTVLYWQGTSRSQMRSRANSVKYITGADTVLECPEGMGVQVYATCRKVGLKLERIKNIHWVHHVAFIGWKKKLIRSQAMKLVHEKNYGPDPFLKGIMEREV